MRHSSNTKVRSTSSCDERFLLESPKLEKKSKPRAKSPLLKYLMEKPRWTEMDVEQLATTLEYFYRKEWLSEEENDLEEQATHLVDEWKRLKVAKPLPSTAYLRRQTRIPSRQTRVIALYKKIRQLAADREKYLQSRMRRFKTHKAQWNESKRVREGDVKYQRIKKAAKLLEKYEPYASNWANGWNLDRG